MKKIFSIILILSIFFLNIEFVLAEDSCKYQSEIEECWEANKSGNPRAIEDFVCPTVLNKEKMTYNIILDKKFKKIDKEANEILESLEQNKDLCFWEKKQKNVLQCEDDIYKLFQEWWVFDQKYQAVLPEVRAETVNCVWPTWVDKIKDYFLNSNKVNQLIKFKNSRRLKIANDFMLLNKQQVRKDNKKKFMQVRRTQYDSVANLFMVNLWYVFRLAFKWVNKTKHPYQG